MTLVKSKIGFQHVGSFLRPQTIKDARKQLAVGEITKADLRTVEDNEIEKLIKKQAAAGLDYVTDGEFRRRYWHLDFFWGFGGVAYAHNGSQINFAHESLNDDTAVLDDQLSFDENTHPFIKDFVFTKSIADKYAVAAKITIPAPSQFYLESLREKPAASVKKFYHTEQAFLDALIHVYRQAISALYHHGARLIQLDDCTWGFLVNAATHDAFGDPEKLQDTFIYLNNGVLADQPADLTTNTHVCRGNYQSDWAFSGGYGPVADKLFGQENVATYFLEYDSDRAGGFEPLAKVSGDKNVVLGLVTSKSPVLEDRQVIIDRIHQAAKYLPLDRLWLSTQCGFASTEEGNNLTEADEWRKLALVKSIIDEVWG